MLSLGKKKKKLRLEINDHSRQRFTEEEKITSAVFFGDDLQDFLAMFRVDVFPRLMESALCDVIKGSNIFVWVLQMLE